MEEQEKKFSVIIFEAMRSRGLDMDKLSQITGVSDRYIKFIIEEKFDKLPSAPYAHGYIIRIANALNLDSDKLWQEYAKDNENIKRSGKEDKMPENRFITQIKAPKILLIILPLLILAIFGITRTLYYVDNPDLEFQNLNNDVTMSTSSSFFIKGKINKDYKLTLNNSEVLLERDGTFKKEVSLESGFNTFIFKAKKILGKEHSVSKQIFYQQEKSKEGQQQIEKSFEPAPIKQNSSTTTTPTTTYEQEN